MTVRVQLALEPRALVVPETAVQTGAAGNYVYVVEDGKAARRDVTVNRHAGELAVIAAGLGVGEQVVEQVPSSLRSGSLYRARHARTAGTRADPAAGVGLVNLCAPFVRRPVMTGVLAASLVIFGAVAYRHLPVSKLPNVDYPTVAVFASLPGASPKTMAAAVAAPIERRFSSIGPRLTAMGSAVHGSRQRHHHAAVRALARHRCRSPGRADRDFAEHRAAAGQHADTARAGEDQPPGTTAYSIWRSPPTASRSRS